MSLQEKHTGSSRVSRLLDSRSCVWCGVVDFDCVLAVVTEKIGHGHAECRDSKKSLSEK